MKHVFSEKIMSRSGCDIHYWISENKDSPWLIFTHGAGTDHRMFIEQISVLYDKFSILLWDARGHGLSRPMGSDFTLKLLVEDLAAIMNREGIDKATFLGQSMGGNAAQEMALRYPDKVESLVLVDCTCNTMKPTFAERFAQKLSRFLLPIYPWSFFVEHSAKISSIKPEVQDYLREALNNVGRKDLSKIMLGMADSLHNEDRSTLDKSTLLVCGESDHVNSIQKTAPIWAAKESYCKFFIIKNAGHCANLDNPTEFNRVLMEFLENQYSDMI